MQFLFPTGKGRFVHTGEDDECQLKDLGNRVLSRDLAYFRKCFGRNNPKMQMQGTLKRRAEWVRDSGIVVCIVVSAQNHKLWRFLFPMLWVIRWTKYNIWNGKSTWKKHDFWLWVILQKLFKNQYIKHFMCYFKITVISMYISFLHSKWNDFQIILPSTF